MCQIEILDLVVEPDECLVSRAGDSINLPQLSFKLFIYLIENAQKTCTLEEISLAVWKNTVVSNETITQRITLLRKALSDDPKVPKYIESVRGRGYRLIVDPIYKTYNKTRLDNTESNKKYNKKQLFSISAILLSLICVAFLIFLVTQTVSDDLSASTDAEKINNTNINLLVRGDYYLNIGQQKNLYRAIDLYHEVLNKEPTNVTALIGLSLSLSKSVCRYNQPKSLAIKAKEYANHAITLDSNNSQAQAALALSWDCLGNIELALEHYLLSLDIDPKNAASIGSAAYLLESKGQLIAAFNLIKRAKTLKPENPMLNLQHAHIFELLKFTTQAQTRYQKLFMLYPDNVFINEAYPRFLLFQGQFSEAKNVFEKVLNRDIERNDIFLYYAELLWLIEGKEKALPWIKKAAEVNPNQSYPKTVQKIMDNQLTLKEVESKMKDFDIMTAEGNKWPINSIEAALMSLWVVKDPEKAIYYLQKAVEFGYLNSEYLTISPLFSPLRKEAKYYQLIDDINQQREKMKQTFLAAYPLPETQ